MARSMAADDTELFRAVVEVTYKDTAPEEGAEQTTRTMVEIAGPYRTKGAATQAITRADSDAKWYARYYDEVTSVGYVERASVTWERVE